MNKYKTKHFGEISFKDESGYKNVRVNYNDHLINIFIDENVYKDKMNICLDIIDKYFEINNIVKDIVLNKYSGKGILKNTYRCWFENFLKKIFDKILDTSTMRTINLKCIQKKMEYPNLYFGINSENNELSIWFSYIISNYCPFGYTIELSVFTNEQFNDFKFGHGEIMAYG